MRETILRSLAIVWCAAAAPPLAAAETPPALRLDDRARPIRAAVDLTIVPENDTFPGQITLDVELRRPSRVLWLNATEITIREATLERGAERRAATVLPGGDHFAGLEFPAPVPAGPARLRIAYDGKFERVDTAGLFKQQDGGRWYVYSQFEALWARRAFPCFDEPAFKIPWRVTLHVKKEHVALSNMPVTGERDEPNGMKMVTYADSPPMPSYLVAVAVGPFDLVGAGSAGSAKTPLRIVAPGGRAAEAGHAARTTGPLLARLEEYFGIPHPYPKLDSIAIPQTVGFGAMENTGLITYVERLILLKEGRTSEDERRDYEDVAAHELAHQWFGNLVTMKWWDDIWLNEGFASWMGDKILGQVHPDWGIALANVARRSRAIDADSLISARQVRQPIEDQGDVYDAFDGITYAKGASLLEAFESWMGEETFRRGVQGYLRRHAHGNATSADFLAALSATGGADVAPAFATFLDQPGVPLVRVRLECGEGAPALRLTQQRFLPLGSAGGGEQAWRIPVRVRYDAGGRAAEARILLAEKTGLLPLPGGPACPAWVVANDRGTGYYLSAYEGDLLRPLLAGEVELSRPEELSVLRDARNLTRGGDLPIGELLTALPRFAASEEREIVEAAKAAAEGLDEMVPDALRTNYQRYVRRLFGPRARALGFRPAPGESAEHGLLRPELLALVGQQGGDAELRADAATLAQRWLADRKAVDPAIAGVVLKLAALDGDAALFDRYLAAVKQEPDRRERRRLFEALGFFQKPELIDRALAAVLSSDFDIRETFRIVGGGVAPAGIGETPAERDQLWAWLQKSYGSLRAQIPQQMRAELPRFASELCERRHRSEVETFFTARLGELTGAERSLAQTLEEIELCAAQREAQAASLAEFLAKQ